MERPRAAVSAGQFSRLSAGAGGDGEEDESNGEADDEDGSEVDEDDADEELNPAIDPNPAIIPFPPEDDPVPLPDPGTFFLKFIFP